MNSFFVNEAATPTHLAPAIVIRYQFKLIFITFDGMRPLYIHVDAPARHGVSVGAPRTDRTQMARLGGEAPSQGTIASQKGQHR